MLIFGVIFGIGMFVFLSLLVGHLARRANGGDPNTNKSNGVGTFIMGAIVIIVLAAIFQFIKGD